LHTNTNAQKAVAFAGIAQNNSFFESLKAFKLTHCISFDDHHKYNDSDVERLHKALKNAGSQAILLTTAKDAVKLRQMSSAAELLSGRIFYRDIKVSFLHGQKRFEESLLQDIAHIQHLKD
jgi:tetraacyldisaccharide-1-P 4'-kinase